MIGTHTLVEHVVPPTIEEFMVLLSDLSILSEIIDSQVRPDIRRCAGLLRIHIIPPDYMRSAVIRLHKDGERPTGNVETVQVGHEFDNRVDELKVGRTGGLVERVVNFFGAFL